MKFELNKRLAEDTDSYERDPVEKYVEFRTEQGEIIEIGNLLFDVEAMLTPFVCDTRLCMGEAEKKGGEYLSCCVVYAPRLSIREKERIEKILISLEERFPKLSSRLEKLEGFYEWDDQYDRLLTKDSKGRCVFLTPNKKDLGFYGCTIHSYCLENNLSPHLYKPSACVMFPLFILDVSDEEETILVTSHNREVMTLGEDEDNYHEMPCLLPNDLAEKPLYEEMKSTLVTMFGMKAWNLLDKAIKARQS